MVDFIENLVSLLIEMIIAPPPASGGGRGECSTAICSMHSPPPAGGEGVWYSNVFNVSPPEARGEPVYLP